MTTSSTLTVSMAHDQAESTMATLTTDLSRNQPHGFAWALGCLAQHRDGEVWPLLVPVGGASGAGYSAAGAVPDRY